MLFDYEDGYWGEGDMDGNITRTTKVTDPWTSKSGDEGGGGGAPPGGESSDGSVSSGAPNAMGQDADTWSYQAEISWDSPIGALSIVPSYSEQASTELRDDVEVTDTSSSTGYSYTTQYAENSTEQKGAEVRLASNEAFTFQWIVGGTYYESNRENITDDYYIDGNDSYMNTKQKNKAVYGNLTYPITEEFRGVAGYRRSWDEASNVETPAKVGDGISGQDYSNPDYKLGVEYDLADNSMVYATYATSYRVNAMAVTSVTDEGSRSVPPEELKSYTIGAKNRFFDNKVQVNVSAYFYDYTNKQFAASEDGRFSGADEVIEADYGIDFNNDGDMVDTNLADTDDRLTENPDWNTSLSGVDISDPWTQQFGDFESYGVDLSTDWIITSRDQLSLSLSYLHAKWTHATIDYYWDGVWASDGDVYDGRTNTYSPTWSGNASYQHNFMIGSFGNLVPQVDVSFQSGYNLSFATSVYPYNYQEEYYLLNGSLTFNHSSGIWSVNAYVKNATNYAVKNFWMNTSGNYSLGLNDPRTYGAVVSVKF
jgi:iron complex outermembrane receptor protein